jgi:hypothetical protein
LLLGTEASIAWDTEATPGSILFSAQQDNYINVA